jgi:hypothetical protein
MKIEDGAFNMLLPNHADDAAISRNIRRGMEVYEENMGKPPAILVMFCQQNTARRFRDALYEMPDGRVFRAQEIIYEEGDSQHD